MLRILLLSAFILVAFGSQADAASCDEVASPAGSTRIGDYCYYVYMDDKKSFKDAQTVCNGLSYSTSSDKYYGRLAVTDDAATMHTLSDEIIQMGSIDSFWVGVIQTDAAAGEPDGGWYWVDGKDMAISEVDKELWWMGQPDDGGEHSRCYQCAFLSPGYSFLEDYKCSYSYPFVCQVYVPQ